MKYSKKACVHDRVVVALNAEVEKYLNYETSASGSKNGYVWVHCHDSRELNFFGVARKFNYYSAVYVRATSPKNLVLEENANIKLLFDDEG